MRLAGERTWAVRVRRRPLGRLGRRLRETVDRRRRDQRLERTAGHEPLADEGLVGRVLEQPPNEVRHAGDEVADRRVDADPEAEPSERRVHRLRHAVEELQLDRVVAHPGGPSARDGVGDAPKAVASEGGPHPSRVRDQVTHAALVAGIGLDLGLEHRHRPAFRPGDDRLQVPVGALHQPDREGEPERPRRPVRERAKILPRILPVRLHDAAELRAVRAPGAQLA